MDPDKAIGEQLEFLPGGMQLTFHARSMDAAGKTVVSLRLTWSYTNTCGVHALSAGQELGRVTFVSIPSCSQLSL